jgi:topoisomerase-4 subunit A
VSTQRVLEEIEEITNPKVKAGKKALSLEQNQLKATLLAVLDGVRDESSKDAAVRLVCEPKTSRIGQQELINTLLAHTSLETSSPHQPDHDRAGWPAHAEIAAPDVHRVDCLQADHHRAAQQHRLHKGAGPHSHPGGQALVLLNIDEVIAIIRQSDDPKAALIARFHLQSGRPKIFWKSACASWPGWKPSRLSRNWQACVANNKSSKKFWAARPPCAA